ncbi:anaphase-promoting complex subunit 13 isoform X1 [Cimex lectularius]|uniref:Anaphase-promoting complex subunit 13 n=2 Tax=Cimex lectularius TaxID=79782 RepID=A0A8I6RBK7_CIMLE|nr:anaphase-promoting complex subunit 13 isoform X1 [Cimex lectularius]
MRVAYARPMDSQVQADGRLLDLVDRAWRSEELPHDEIIVPAAELPDPEADNGDSHTTLKEAQSKWTDLSLSGLGEQQFGSVLHNVMYI